MTQEPPGLPQNVAAVAAATDDLVTSRARSTVAMILGGGDTPTVTLRRAVRDELVRNRGYRDIIVMEDQPDDGMDPDDKWDRILEQRVPEFFIFVLAKDARPGGVHYELGSLRTIFKKAVKDRVCFAFEKNADLERLSGYLKGIMHRVGCQEYVDMPSLVDVIETELRTYASRLVL